MLAESFKEINRISFLKKHIWQTGILNYLDANFIADRAKVLFI